MKKEEDTFQKFSEWLTPILAKKMPKDIIAFNFNLYENETSYHIQLIGAKSFSADDPDWACDEVFSTGENIFIIDKSIAGKAWLEGLDFCKKLIQRYLDAGKQKEILLQAKGVAAGFVSGDLVILYQK